jgi:tellurite resistance protein/adenylate kinase family enzyme
VNHSSTDLVAQFRESLGDCKRLYIQAARIALQDQPGADDEIRRDLIRRMVGLHQGLLIKIYTSVARADEKWSREERELACELVDHLWQQRLEGAKLREVAHRMFSDASRLQWYSLLRPFDRIAKIRNFVSELETIVLRVANLVAKADGTVSTRETDTILSIQHEIQVHLCRIQLDEPVTGDSRSGASSAIQIIHHEPTLLKTQQEQQLQLPCDAVETTGTELSDTLEQALKDLDQLIGLDGVKQEITTLTNYLSLQQHRREASLPVHQLSLHMVFAGNPGTGKTTVARIVGRIFKSLGLLKRGHLVETDRSGMVAEYAGQTAPKTQRKIDEAMDGILFIDEAYSLIASGREDAYGNEAVQAIVKRMEDDREQLVVIIAGYPEPIDQLLHSNPGFSSRFNTQLVFEDYLPTQLARIFQLMCETNHYELPCLARAKLLLGFQWLYESRDEHFGNGRLARNTFENSVRRLANRVAAVTPVTRELLTVLTADDIDLNDVPAGIWKHLDDNSLRFGVTCQQCAKPVHVRMDQLGHQVGCPHCRAVLQAEWGEWVRTG